MITKISPDVFQLDFDEFGSCVYLINPKEPVLIDTSSKENRTELLVYLGHLKIPPESIKTILLTHHHPDHIGNLEIFKNAKIYDEKNIEEFQKEKSKNNQIKVIEVPGHTKDSLAFLYKDILFSGDTLFNDGYIGRTDFPESQPEKMLASLKKLQNLKYKILCPGHI
jgi:glyoxylase-like metal-dependent hydrolase (beta-lactamase superfamily II)